MCVSNLQNEPEQWVVLHLPVPNLDVLALLDGEPAQERVQYRIHTLTDAFQQQAVPVAHCSLNGVQVAVWRGEGRGGEGRGGEGQMVKGWINAIQWACMFVHHVCST